MRRPLKLFIIFLITFCVIVSGPWSTGIVAAEAAGNTNGDYLQGFIEMIKGTYGKEVTDEQLVEAAIRGMLSSLDPYTAYYDLEEAEDYFGDISGKYAGIGIGIEKEQEHVVVLQVFEGSPAEEEGILSGDKLVSIDGESVVGQSVEYVQSKVRGKPQTKLEIGILRNGHDEIINIEIMRAEIVINPVYYDIRNGIGYIRISSFNANTYANIDRALAEMDQKNIKKVVLDLRNNPGGLVDQATAVAGRFVKKGLIAKLDFKSELFQDTSFYSDLSETKYKLAVLVNENSASASEILAGAIKDTRAGKLIGTKTFGKAKVQTTIPVITQKAFEKYNVMAGSKAVDMYDLVLNYGISPQQDDIMGYTKITAGYYTTPSGKIIDEIGIKPDITVKNYELVNGIDVGSIRFLKGVNEVDKGVEATEVLQAEKILKLSGYISHNPDIKLDEKTSIAIERFQKERNYKVTGMLDKATQTGLNKLLDYKLQKIDAQYMRALQVLKLAK